MIPAAVNSVKTTRCSERTVDEVADGAGGAAGLGEGRKEERGGGPKGLFPSFEAGSQSMHLSPDRSVEEREREGATARAAIPRPGAGMGRRGRKEKQEEYLGARPAASRPPALL
ncbi:hypothetical protein ZWY2020_059319 [Hordeum vulgare]|nr:hypothetical protein ZWY2020_059319 [Hordeum vulgare]